MSASAFVGRIDVVISSAAMRPLPKTCDAMGWVGFFCLSRSFSCIRQMSTLHSSISFVVFPCSSHSLVFSLSFSPPPDAADPTPVSAHTSDKGGTYTHTQTCVKGIEGKLEGKSVDECESGGDISTQTRWP